MPLRAAGIIIIRASDLGLYPIKRDGGRNGTESLTGFENDTKRTLAGECLEPVLEFRFNLSRRTWYCIVIHGPLRPYRTTQPRAI
jgi:hypothetical protein